MATKTAANRSSVTRSIGAALRRIKTSGDRVAATFAADHAVHHTDLAALVHIMAGESSGAPLTAGRLQHALGLSSGAVTAVVDRLERLGHVRRDRDIVDRRRIHLHVAANGRTVGAEYFGPLGGMADQVMARFTVSELETIDRFLTDMAQVYDDFVDRATTD
jgi:DNA-binding MarR family transcriptional regulator